MKKNVLQMVCALLFMCALHHDLTATDEVYYAKYFSYGKSQNPFPAISGLIAAPFTPMYPDGSINLERIEDLFHHLKKHNVKGAFVSGSTGEGLSLTVEERKAIAERWVMLAKGQDFSVIIHVGDNCIVNAQALAKHAQEIGADAIASLAPNYYKPADNAALVEFCAAIANQAPALPFYFYHIPSMTGVSVPMEQFLAVAKERIPTFAGVKFTHENTTELQRCLQLYGDSLNFLFGRDEMLLAALSLNVQGAVGSTYNFASPLYLKMIEAFERGELYTAQMYQIKAIEMIDIFRKHGGLPAFKAVMDMLGVDCGPTRSPLVPLTTQQKKSLERDLRSIGFFEWCK